MNNKFLLSALIATLFCSCAEISDKDYTKYVDQYIGTGGHGHVFMGANVPFGAVQLGPTSIPESWDWVSGYHISDTTVIGFSHTHLSGTGIGDLSDISLMPVVGEVTLARGNHDSYDSGMWSYFSRKNEKAKPGYYATHLDRYGIDVELTATKRVGFHKYSFPTSTESSVVFDLENGTCWDSPTEGYLAMEDSVTIVGYRYSKGWADAQRVYFVAKLSQPIKDFKVTESRADSDGGRAVSSHYVYGEAFLDTQADQPLYIKVAISPVSVENAKLNMADELPGWDFEQVATEATKAWNSELSKIDIETKEESVQRIFYTALYHTMIAPSEFCDVNGDYRGADGEVYRNADFVNYTTLSLWDTYRAAHPLMTIIHPEKMSDMMNTMVHIYEQQGKLPVWHLMGCETNCMVGNPGIPVVADAILKGYGGFDIDKAYQGMKASAMLDDRGMDLLKEYGYIPSDKMVESVAYNMEYALADWAVAQVAQKLGEQEDYDYFMNRSKSYKKFFDKETQFIRGVTSKGEFNEPFNPFHSAHRINDYCEGNAWQYTWLAPHDLDGLVELFEGKDNLLVKLDSLFVADGDMGAHASPDVSGLIGQYAHGNEPSHHIIYFYTMLGEPAKAANRVREVLKTMYHDKPNGLSGNEDAGQMSSWYILSSMGFYQVEPAGGRYYFGSPILDRAAIRLADNRSFTITAKNNSDDNRYIKSIKLNGVDYKNNYINYADIAKGGVLEFEMSNQPHKWF